MDVELWPFWHLGHQIIAIFAPQEVPGGVQGEALGCPGGPLGDPVGPWGGLGGVPEAIYRFMENAVFPVQIDG